jgi:hypothetical protein
MVVVVIVAMLPRRNPVRMMTLHPRMIVPNPPITIVPGVMVGAVLQPGQGFVVWVTIHRKLKSVSGCARMEV